MNHSIVILQTGPTWAVKVLQIIEVFPWIHNQVIAWANCQLTAIRTPYTRRQSGERCWCFATCSNPVSFLRVTNLKFPLQPHTVCRTWLLIAHSDERWLYYQFSLHHWHIFSLTLSLPRSKSSTFSQPSQIEKYKWCNENLEVQSCFIWVSLKRQVLHTVYAVPYQLILNVSQASVDLFKLGLVRTKRRRCWFSWRDDKTGVEWDDYILKPRERFLNDCRSTQTKFNSQSARRHSERGNAAFRHLLDVIYTSCTYLSLLVSASRMKSRVHRLPEWKFSVHVAISSNNEDRVKRGWFYASQKTGLFPQTRKRLWPNLFDECAPMWGPGISYKAEWSCFSPLLRFPHWPCDATVGL